MLHPIVSRELGIAILASMLVSSEGEEP